MQPNTSSECATRALNRPRDRQNRPRLFTTLQRCNAATRLALSLALGWGLASLAVAASTITPLPDKVAPVIADRQDFQNPDRVHLTGWVGARIQANESNRLARLDPSRLLEGYRKRPGRQT
jgi:hypothetical protein